MDNQNKGVLLLGNGINLAFEEDNENFIPDKINWNFLGLSWENIIKQIIFNYKSDVVYKDISNLPPPMQIVIATKDNVDKAMNSLCENMLTEKISEEKKIFCQKLLSLPLENIITTNYSYELEQSAGICGSKQAYYRTRKHTKDVTQKEKTLKLYTYCDLKSVSKKLWHIHGDAASPDSVIMGHYYYGKLLKEIEKRVSSFIRIYKSSNGKNTKSLNLSWVDSFLQNDVYILGFGFDLSELDLWWLACCKKRNFKETKIHYYTHKSELDKGFELMLNSYNIKIHKIPLKDNNFVEYYENAIIDIEKKLKEGKN